MAFNQTFLSSEVITKHADRKNRANNKQRKGRKQNVVSPTRNTMTLTLNSSLGVVMSLL